MAAKDELGDEASARRAGSPSGKRVLCAFDNSCAAARALQFAAEKLVNPEKGDRIVLFQAIPKRPGKVHTRTKFQLTVQWRLW